MTSPYVCNIPATICLYLYMRLVKKWWKSQKNLAMEVKKSFFIPNNNKQDGNKTLKNS